MTDQDEPAQWPEPFTVGDSAELERAWAMAQLMRDLEEWGRETR